MDEAERGPRAVVVLLRDGREVLLGPVYAPDRCDLGFVDGLLRVQLAARRFGWSIKLRNVRPDLRELVELVGLQVDLVEGDPPQSSRNGGSPNSAKSSG